MIGNVSIYSDPAEDWPVSMSVNYRCGIFGAPFGASMCRCGVFGVLGGNTLIVLSSLTRTPLPVLSLL